MNTYNYVILGIIFILIIWQILLFRKPFKVTKASVTRSVIFTPIIMVVYAFLLNASILNPAAWYLFLAGIVIGFFYGLFTKVYLVDLRVMAKRSNFYIAFWGIVYLLTQFLAQYLGSGGVTLGLTLMMLSLGILLAQYGLISLKALVVSNQKKQFTTK